MTPLQHAKALVALLEQEQASGDTEPAGEPRATMGVQISPAVMAQLCELADRQGLTPDLVLRMALRALELQPWPKGKPEWAPYAERAELRRMVGKERGVLEGKR